MLRLLRMISIVGSSAMVGAAAVVAVQALAQSPQPGQKYKVVTVANRSQIEAVANDLAKQG
jgi:cell division protein YceG involved in septum cleavage